MGIALSILALLIGLALLAFEWGYRRRVGNKFELTPGNWKIITDDPTHYVALGNLELINLTERREIMIPELKAEVTLLSKGSLEGITSRVQVVPRHYDMPARPDGYWFAYIVKQKPTHAEVVLDLRGEDLSQLQSAWMRIHYITYGPQGRIPKVRHIVLPLQFPAVEDSKHWRSAANANLLPIRTHLLTHLDHPVEIIKRYVLPHAQPGDVITLGETPVALMQGRFRHPTEIQPGWLARRICYFFLPTSSLATACGMQSLVDIVGPGRVLLAFILGALAKKFLKQPGMFYQLAGEQARLIDDVTGTLPPYDQFVVLGPDNPQQVVDQIQRETGLAAAIVDVNDLKAVKILAASPGVPSTFLEQALVTNPAGNADEQTPLVLIRPV
ncbi:F420-0:Gamma-glutamyl ligase [Leptolyngbya sp. NK1-12]|uniref:F420-0:Gamma-glutamyl ligase n=1 Tax=Leptolyngbya sp. NK1-12 TaxID=2547451 RepID=A0AA97AH80_9CYAN|nr:F420-0--gamma-glutamyl ligase [Leptolyngbya sp. NK1-12]WNZ25155.1 F420-0:Gamma-glutamyl ligase [Leptolyngbya sp. NK1-12]